MKISFRQLHPLMYGALGLALLPAGVSAVVIDKFTTYQIVSVSGPPVGFKSASGSELAPEAVGGERDIYVERNSANRGSVEVEVAGFGAGIANYNSGVLTTGRGLIVWDGVDNSPTIVPTGLGGLDLTDGGLHSAFRLSQTSDLGGALVLTIYQDATHISEAIINIAADPTFTFSPQLVPFTSFIPTGSAGGADFANVGAISLLLDGGTAGADIGVSSLSTVAAPDSPISLLAVGSIWLCLFGAARRFQFAR